MNRLAACLFWLERVNKNVVNKLGELVTRRFGFPLFVSKEFLLRLLLGLGQFVELGLSPEELSLEVDNAGLEMRNCLLHFRVMDRIRETSDQFDALRGRSENGREFSNHCRRDCLNSPFPAIQYPKHPLAFRLMGARCAAEFRGARSSRALAKASRLRGLPCHVAAECVNDFWKRRVRKVRRGGTPRPTREKRVLPRSRSGSHSLKEAATSRSHGSN